MNKRKIDVFDYAGTILKALKPGILLTSKKDGFVNSMVIGWGTLGTNWTRPTFVAYVRDSRYTRQLLDENPEFTINVPLGEPDPEVIKICGSKSGRDMDKIAAAGLTLVEANQVSVPAVKEFPLTLECRVLYSQLQEADKLPEEIAERFYPAGQDGYRDAHFTYYGEIVDAYIIED